MEWKLALISEHASPLALVGGVDAGGQNIAVAELALALAKIGYQIDIFTRWDDKNLPQVVEWQPNIRVIHLQAGPIAYVPKEDLLPYMSEFTANFIQFSQQEGNPYCLIHAHFFMSALVAADVKKALGIPFVVTFHALGKVRRMVQGDCDRFPANRSEIEERIIREADQLVALCPQDRDDLVTLYNARPDKITVVPNGVNTSEFYVVDKLLARLLLGLDPNEIIILQLGRMVPRKGVDNVVRAVGMLRREHGIWARLLVVGGESDVPDASVTPEIGRLQQLAREEGVDEWVTFVGRRQRDTLRYYYSAADAFVTTPLYEPFGITPLEAMACGVPVIGSEVGGIKHTIVDGQSGFLVPPNDPQKLTSRLLTLIQYPRIQNALRRNALRRVHSHFTWQHVAQQTATLYERVGLTRPQVARVEIIEPALASKTRALSRSA